MTAVIVQSLPDYSHAQPVATAATVEQLQRKAVLRGPLDGAQQADLLRVAARCPVHRTLQNALPILDTMDVVA